MGDYARLKLSEAERHQRGRWKSAPYLSRKYRVVGVLQCGWSYLVTPDNKPIGKVQLRYYNKLEKAPIHLCSWEPVEGLSSVSKKKKKKKKNSK